MNNSKDCVKLIFYFLFFDLYNILKKRCKNLFKVKGMFKNYVKIFIIFLTFSLQQ